MNNCVTPFIFYQLIFFIYLFFLYVDIVRQTKEIGFVQSWLAFEPKINVFSLPEQNTYNYTSPQTRFLRPFQSYKIMYILCLLYARLRIFSCILLKLIFVCY